MVLAAITRACAQSIVNSTISPIDYGSAPSALLHDDPSNVEEDAPATVDTVDSTFYNTTVAVAPWPQLRHVIDHVQKPV